MKMKVDSPISSKIRKSWRILLSFMHEHDLSLRNQESSSSLPLI